MERTPRQKIGEQHPALPCRGVAREGRTFLPVPEDEAVLLEEGEAILREGKGGVGIEVHVLPGERHLHPGGRGRVQAAGDRLHRLASHRAAEAREPAPGRRHALLRHHVIVFTVDARTDDERVGLRREPGGFDRIGHHARVGHLRHVGAVGVVAGIVEEVSGRRRPLRLLLLPPR